MLNSILTKYTKVSNQSNIYDEDLGNKVPFADKTLQSSKSRAENSEDFLNENENLSMKKKCDEVLKKYCSLYKDEEEIKFSNGKNNINDTNDKYAIKPLNYRYTDQKNRRVEHAQTTGEGWFNMKAPELTPELKEDLKTIQLRHVIDPSRFYKKLDRNNLPKFFQVGTILDNIIDGKKNRLKKSQVKSRLAEEFLEVDREKNYSLRKFEELQDQRRKVGLNKTKLNKYKMKSKNASRKSGFVAK